MGSAKQDYPSSNSMFILVAYTTDRKRGREKEKKKKKQRGSVLSYETFALKQTSKEKKF